MGEFYDLKKMVDWARATGLKVIQILPINDTTMTGTWQDSYPYNANSTYALHPQFLRLEAVGRLSDKRAMAKYRKLGKELNALPEVDYERVNTAKASYLKELFAEQGAATLASEEFIEFSAATRRGCGPMPPSAPCATGTVQPISVAGASGLHTIRRRSGS